MMTRRKQFRLYYSLPFFFLIPVLLQAQQRSVTIYIITNDKQVVPYATVSAINASDTNRAVQKVTDSLGIVFLLISSVARL